MASSWIKVEVITPDKPEIFQIAELLNIDPDAVLGKLVRIWAWADQQTIDGNAGSVTKGVLDRLAFITGFADALITVGWLAYVDEKLVLPNFERHNGESSKKRALTNRRVAEHRKPSGVGTISSGLNAFPMPCPDARAIRQGSCLVAGFWR
jgi:DNA replication protein DnaT